MACTVFGRSVGVENDVTPGLILGRALGPHPVGSAWRGAFPRYEV